jgi:ankyrin repeat protein
VFGYLGTPRLDRKLERAVADGNAQAVAYLLKAGATADAVNAGTGSSLTPLGQAAKMGSVKIVKLLLDHGAAMEAQDNDGYTPLQRAVRSGQFEVVEELLRRGASLKHPRAEDIPLLNRLLLQAAGNGNVRDMRILLDCGAEIEARGGDDLHWNGTPLSIVAYKGYLSAVKFLLDRGADVNAADKDGDTVINAAIIHDKADVVEELLKRGANPAIRSHRHENGADLARKKDSRRLHALLGVEDEMRPLTTPDDEVTFRRAFGGRVLEETFNFAAKERISLILKTPEGPVEAMTRDSFDAIGDRSALRRAYDAYAAKGGKLPESDFFPETLGKVKAAPPKAD